MNRLMWQKLNDKEMVAEVSAPGFHIEFKIEDMQEDKSRKWPYLLTISGYGIGIIHHNEYSIQICKNRAEEYLEVCKKNILQVLA